MKTRILGWIPFLALIALVGCKPKPEPGPTGSGQAPVAENGAAETPSIDNMPEALRHAGFRYYGLSSDRVQRYSYLQETADAETPDDQGEGTQRVEFLGMDGDQARFSIARDGALATIGNTINVVSEEGVYATEFAGVEFDELILELPAILEVGTSWPLELDAADTGMSISMSGQSEVVERETITTPAGEFETIKVVATVTFTQGDSNSGTIQIENWLAEDLGSIRMVLLRKQEGSPDTTITVELVGFGEAEGS